MEFLSGDDRASIEARGERLQDAGNRIIDIREVEYLFASVQRDVFAEERLRHELRDYPLRQVSLAAVHIRKPEDDGMDGRRQGRIRVGTAGPLRAEFRHPVDGERFLRMVLVDGKILRLAVHFPPRGVEEEGPSLRFPARLQDIQRAELVRRPTRVRIDLPPGDPRDGGKVEDRVVACNGVLDRAVVTDIAANLRTLQRRRVAVEVHVEKGDGMARLLEPLRQMATDESISTGD